MWPVGAATIGVSLGCWHGIGPPETHEVWRGCGDWAQCTCFTDVVTASFAEKRAGSALVCGEEARGTWVLEGRPGH